MSGSAGLASWIAQVLFWALLLIGVGAGELGGKSAAALAALWALGYFGLQSVPGGAMLLTPCLAIVDIALVFLIFKGDVRLR
jgi:hypothetical protein